MGIKETRLHAKAIRERWPVSSTGRAKIIRRLEAIVGIGPKPKTGDVLTLDGLIGLPRTREVISAIRALLQADRLNLEQAAFEHATRPAEQIDDDYVIDLGAEDNPALPPAP